jgi:CMP-N-acetylneuraminic acid synthetase
MSHRVLGIIPARGGSKGIPRKNIFPIAGKPLLAWSIEAAREAADVLDRVVVSTEDAEIAAVAARYGAEVVPRPPALAVDSATSESAIVHALEHLAGAGYEPEAVILLQPTSPLRTAAHIRDAVTRFFDGGFETLVSISPVHELPFLPQPDGSLRPGYERRARRQDREPMWFENGAVFMCSAALAKQGKIFGERMGYLKMPRDESVDIDDMTDMTLAETLLKRREGIV